MKKVHILIPSLTTICLLPFASTISCNKEKAYDGIPINIPQEVTVDFGFSTVNIQVLSSEPIDIKSGHTYTFNVKMSD